MRYAIKYTVAATLVASAAASGHHNHQRFHAKKEAASPVEQRDASVVTEVVVGPTETVYELSGEVLDADEAQEGIDAGNYVVVGETTPTYVPPPPPPKPTTTKEPDMGAQFIEKPTPAPEPSPKPSPKPEKPAGGQGLTSKFPSGKVKCSSFPSDYGALALDWLDFSGWAGIQNTPGYTSASVSISEIHTGIEGDGCSPGAMCSYACPPGYQKTQWPKAQGATKQSIGGLYCNKQGFLELTRPDHDTLCEKGMGGVSIKNDLKEVVATCRTDYPGTEAMVIPATAGPGETVELTNPDQNAYYQWDGMATSAQYYINKLGYGNKDACVWNSAVDPEGAGNWSPMNAGVGYDSGITYLSIFLNKPTSNAALDFNVEITGDVTTKCAYTNGQFTGGGDGCTTGLKEGGKAVFRYF